MKKKSRVIVLLSGGLDSQLALKIMINFGLEVVALSFSTPFFNSEKARLVCKNFKIPLIEKDISQKHFLLLKNPPHGYGKNMNPCIDCHGLMFRLAGEIMKKNNFDCLVTGEVLGQRPMSQNKQSLKTVEKIAGLTGYILRPLSAQNLEETILEKEGALDRNKLFDFQGKSRKPQIALAAKYGLKDYPTPASGCRLTDPGFSKKLRALLDHDDLATPDDTRLLSLGRLFLLGKNSFMILGRNEDENKQLTKSSQKIDYLVYIKDWPGPTALARIKKPDNFEKIFAVVANKIKNFSRQARAVTDQIIYMANGEEIKI